MGLIAEAPYPSSSACCAIAVAISFSGCLFLLSLRDHLLATDADGGDEETQDILHRSLARPTLRRRVGAVLLRDAPRSGTFAFFSFKGDRPGFSAFAIGRGRDHCHFLSRESKCPVF